MDILINNDRYLVEASDEQKSIYTAYSSIDNKEMYHIPFILKIPANLSNDNFINMISKIVKKNEILRTTFELRDTIYQKVNNDIPLEIECLKTNTQENIIKFINNHFDLENGPCFRIMILEKNDNELNVLFCFHHLIFDGSSREIFINELKDLCNGKDIFNKLDYQYSDYVTWKKVEQDKNLLECRQYWKSKAEVVSKHTSLPINLKQESEDGIYKTTINDKLMEKVDQFCSENKLTRSLFINYAFSLTLKQISNENTPICIPISERSIEEFEETIGLFLKTSLIINEFNENDTLRTSIQNYKKNYIEIFKYKDIAFEEQLSLLGLNRNTNNSLPFFINYEMQQDAEWEVVEFDENYSKFPLSIYILDKESELNLRVCYNHKTFNYNFCEILINQFTNIIRQILTLNLNSSIKFVKLLSDFDNQLLPDPKEHQPEYNIKGLYEYFISSAEKNKNKTAITHGKNNISYGKLQYFLKKTVSFCNSLEGDYIGVFGNKSIEYICLMLGIISSGKTFIPIEPNLNSKKVDEIITKTNLKTIITLNKEVIIDSQNIKKVNYSFDILDSYDCCEQNFFRKISFDKPAYIYFTSGSTGEPKGIMGKQNSLVHFINWQREKFNITNLDRFGQLVNVGFDVFLRDTLTPLISGAEIIIPNEVNNMSSEYLKKFLSDYEINIIHTVPSLARNWLQNNPDGLSHLNIIFFAGEPLNYEIVKNIRRNPSFNGEIINLYGPSETTLAKSHYIVPQKNVYKGIQPIGRPIDDTQLLILKNKNKLCGIFEVGEIAIRTPFTSFGYIDGKTFIRNPFTESNDDKIFMTGDYGRYNIDGIVEILGRKDDQIKINGVKVNRREIESILLKNGNISQAYVTNQFVNQKNVLIAYVVANDSFSEDNIRNFCKNYISPNFIPNRFIQLNKLPTNSNGKVDIALLPTYEEKIKVEEKLNKDEKILVKLVGNLVEAEKVMLDDDFFDLGGHSLLVVQLINKIEVSFDVKLTFKEIYKNSSIREIAYIISSKKRESQDCLEKGNTESSGLQLTKSELDRLNDIYN